ncbi:hypothetical protein [Neomicrococcus lactis]|uniref:DUF8083 domain-containing protein n=1 Tax=Neomicrococcus lactis TaxID=732241 RepID=A0A7W8YBX6_9MICC|nr:hypothetical protein [Neomicrococcus lactis]MBB5598691.1 hypothetical protein [Neomicrococcus lactis]
MIESSRSFQHEFAVPVASLRIYERLEAFPAGEQAKILARPDLTNQQIDAAEREEAMQRLIQPAVDPFPKKLDSPYRAVSYPTEEGGFTSYYCPSQLTERVALACAYFDDEMRPSVREAIIPVPARESFSMRAADYFGRSLDDFLREHSASAPITDETLGAETPAEEAEQDSAAFGEGLYSQQSTWGIPTTWFWLIDPVEDVTVVEATHDPQLGLNGDITGARVLVPMSQALARLTYTAASMALHAPQVDLFDDLTDLSRWLGRFSRDSIVEVDYGKLAQYVWPDDSSRDLRDWLEAIEDKDVTTATLAYRRYMSRWLSVRGIARSN